MAHPTEYLAWQVDLDAPEIVAAYDEMPLWSAMFGLLLLRHIPLKPGAQVLDVGCGTGPLLELAQRLGAGSTVYGIDPWAAAVARAREKAQIWGVQNVELHQADAAYAIPAATFDLIVSNLGINNFRDPVAVLAECWRTTKPGATLALTTNLQGHMHELYAVFAATLREVGDAQALRALERQIATRATIDRVAALFAQTGFQLSRVYEEATTMRFADGSALLRHAFIKIGFLEGWRSVLQADAQEAVFARLEANLNRAAQVDGELRLTIPMAYIEAKRVP